MRKPKTAILSTESLAVLNLNGMPYNPARQPLFVSKTYCLGCKTAVEEFDNLVRREVENRGYAGVASVVRHISASPPRKRELPLFDNPLLCALATRSGYVEGYPFVLRRRR